MAVLFRMQFAISSMAMVLLVMQGALRSSQISFIDDTFDWSPVIITFNNNTSKMEEDTPIMNIPQVEAANNSTEQSEGGQQNSDTTATASPSAQTMDPPTSAPSSGEGNAISSATSSSSNETPQDPHHFRFEQENLLSGGLCGYKKCVYRLKANPSYGYLVRGAEADPSFGHLVGGSKTEMNTYNISKIITDQYHMQSTLLMPSTLVNVTPSFAAWLDDNQQVDDNKPNPRFATLTQINIQMVEYIPNGFVFQTSKMKGINDWMELLAWLQGHVLDTQNHQERNQTLARFTEGLEKMDGLLRDIPCLWFDFQILIRTTGDIVHLDLDRCFAPKAPRIARNTKQIRKKKTALWESLWYIQESLAKGQLCSPVAAGPSLIPNGTCWETNRNVTAVVQPEEVPIPCDWKCYLHTNPDVARALGTTKRAALVHWKTHGKAEGRSCSCND